MTSLKKLRYLLTQTSISNFWNASFAIAACSFLFSGCKNKKLKLVSSFHGCYSLIQTGIIDGRIDPAFAKSFSLHLQQIFTRINGFVYVTKHQLNFPAEVGIMDKQHEKIYYGYTPSLDDGVKLLPDSHKDDAIIVGMVACVIGE